MVAKGTPEPFLSPWMGRAYRDAAGVGCELLELAEGVRAAGLGVVRVHASLRKEQPGCREAGACSRSSLSRRGARARTRFAARAVANMPAPSFSAISIATRLRFRFVPVMMT